MPSSRQDREYRQSVIDKIESSINLDDAIEWIKSNLNPEDVFNAKDLRQWADENDYVAKEID